MSAPVFLGREALERLLTPEACLEAVERAFRLGRESGDEIIVFDSTGIGLQDVAAAIAALLRSRDRAHAAGGQVGLPAGGDPAIEHP